MMNILPATRTTRLSSKASALVQDENKAPAGKAVDKKVAKRPVLGDISNQVKAAPTGKGAVKAAEKPAIVVPKPKLFNKPADKPQPHAEPSTKPAPFIKDAFVDVRGSADFFPQQDVDKKDFDMDDINIEPIEDIDANDRDDPQCCVEYVHEIFEYCHNKEVLDKVRPDYMGDQVDINEKMRAILVDWMVEVHVKFKLLTETMFLSVNIVDRFLALKPVARQKLQLVGITAMLIASKYEEIYAPELRDFIHIADKAYTRDEVLKMERLMLTALDFNLSTSTPLHFLRRYSKASKSDSRTHTLSKYLSELTLTEYGMLKYLPSHIAAASVYLARCMTTRSPWSATLEKYSGVRDDDIIDCVRDLNTVLKKAVQVGYKLEHSDKPPSGMIYAVYKKYCSERLLAVAKIAPVEL